MQGPLYPEDLQTRRWSPLLFRTSSLFYRRSMVSPTRRSSRPAPATTSTSPLNQYKVITVPDNVRRAESRLLLALSLPYQISCSQRVNVLVLSFGRRGRSHFPTCAASIPLLTGGMEADSTPNLFHESVFAVIPLLFQAPLQQQHPLQPILTHTYGFYHTQSLAHAETMLSR